MSSRELASPQIDFMQLNVAPKDTEDDKNVQEQKNSKNSQSVSAVMNLSMRNSKRKSKSEKSLEPQEQTVSVDFIEEIEREPELGTDGVRIIIRDEEEDSNEGASVAPSPKNATIQQKLPEIKKVASTSSIIDSDETCIICMDTFKSPAQRMNIPCANCTNQPVHAKCIFEWKERSNLQESNSATCPLCRGPLGFIDYTPPDKLCSWMFRYTEARKAFVQHPIPKSVGMVRCYIRVIVTGSWYSPTTTYELWMEDIPPVMYPLGELPNARNGPMRGDVLLLTAKKRFTKTFSPRIDISLDQDCKNFKPDSDDYIGTLVSSFYGLEHTIVSTHKEKNSTGEPKVHTYEIAAVQYNQNRVGISVGPRRMKISIPHVVDNEVHAKKVHTNVLESVKQNTSFQRQKLNSSELQQLEEMEGEVKSYNVDSGNTNDEDDEDDAYYKRFLHETEKYEPESKIDSILSKLKGGKNEDKCMFAENKQPKWLEAIQSYSLDFHGRVTHASNKNFQMLMNADSDKIVLQFGKISSRDDSPMTMYTMDVQYPLSPLQAFGICLSSCDRKLACA